MHHFILKCFDFFRSTMQFLKIVCVMIILVILLYWIQNLTGAQWSWFEFMRPPLDTLLEISDKIYSGSFNFFGALFEFKYAIAVLIMIIIAVIINTISNFSHEIQRIYHNSRIIFKKANENVFNKNLQKKVEKEERKLQEYHVIMKARLKKKYAIEEFNANIKNEHIQIHQFVVTQLGIKPTDCNITHADLYYFSEYKFENFDKIDPVLEILFKAMNANTRLEYSICVQIENNPKKLAKLASLNHFNKITMAADTAYRYTYVKNPKYTTSMVGLFQNDDNMLEIHEFNKIE